MDLCMCLLNPNKAGKRAPAMASYIETSANFTSIDFFRSGFRMHFCDNYRARARLARRKLLRLIVFST
jgi:hypothetical protein